MPTCSEDILYLLPVPHFFTQCGGVGGHIAHALGVLDALQRAGSTVHVVCGPGAPWRSVDARPTTSVERTGVGLPGRLLWSRRYCTAVAGTLAAPDGAISLVYTRFSTLFSPWMPRIRRLAGERPLILEVNSFAGLRHPVVRPLEKQAFQSADLVLCVSEVLARQVVAAGLACPARTVVIPNGVDLERFSDQPKTNRPAHEFRIVYTGVFKKGYCGLDTVLDGFSRLRNRRKASLHLFGAGPWAGPLRALAQRIPDVVVHAPIPFDQVPEHLHDADVLVNGSTHQYGSPMKVYEYMASLTPIVSARTPQVEGLLGAEERGLLYAAGNAAELAAKLELLMDDPHLGTRLAAAARAEVERAHSWDRRIEQLGEALARLRGVRPTCAGCPPPVPHE